MDMQHEVIDVAKKWTCNIDMDMQHAVMPTTMM
jgi:hypothetical protein